jgi:hypothetical protein
MRDKTRIQNTQKMNTIEPIKERSISSVALDVANNTKQRKLKYHAARSLRRGKY